MTPSRAPWSRRLRWLAGGGVLVLLMRWWLRPPPVPVATAMIDRGPIRVTIDEAGITRVRRRTGVSAPITGLWAPSVLTEGDVLPVGALLGTLYPVPLDPAVRAEANARVAMADAAVREAAAHVDVARIAAADAERTAFRVRRLGEAGAMSAESTERARDAVVQARQALVTAEARARAAAAQAEGARAVLRRGSRAALPVRAPVAGVLLSLPEPQRRVVVAGTPLVTMGNPADLEVLVPVLTVEVSRIREGATAWLRVDRDGMADPPPASSGPGPGVIIGRVARIEPTAFTRVSALGVEEQRVHVVITMPDSTHHRLRLGDQFRLQTSITVWEIAAGLRVPVSALVRDGSEWSVWVVAAGRARRRVIRLGERSPSYAHIQHGLASGETVVVYPGESIRDGVRLRSERPAPAR